MPAEDPFAHIVNRAKSGDEAALAELFDAFFEKIFRYIAKRVDTTQSAEDICSDVFLEMASRIQDFESRSTFSTWLYSITKNKIADFWREKYKTPTVPLEEFLLYENAKNDEQNADDFDLAEEKWQYFESLVANLLDHLSEIPRELLKLRFLQNYTLEEAAEELNINKNTAKVTQFRALKKLRQLAKSETISFTPPK